MTDLYDISANPKDPIDRERVQEAIKWANGNSVNCTYGLGHHFHDLLSAASAWLEAADDMPEEMKEPNYGLNKYDQAWCIGYQKGFDGLVLYMKKMLRIAE